MTISNEWVEDAGHDGHAPWRRGVALLAALVALGAALVLGLHFYAGGNSHEANAAGSIGNVPQTAAETTDRGSGGYARTAQGAGAAARHFLKVGGGNLVAKAGAYRRAMANISAPEWRAQARQTGDNAAAFFRRRYGQGGSMVTVPLATEVSSFNARAASVKLLWVSIAEGPKVSKGEQIWGRTRLQLRRVEGSWLISDNQTASMPPPPLIPGQVPGSAAQALEEFGA